MRDDKPQESIWAQTADKVARIFPYFFAAYLVTLVVGFFYDSLNKYLNLVGFTSAIILLGIFSLFSPQFRAGGLTFFASKLTYAYKLLLRYKYRTSIVVIFAVMCGYFGADVTELLIAAFGALTVLFMWDSRISGGLALVCLGICPILLLFHLEALAEVAAVYAYYFLIITVVSELVQLKIKSYPLDN